ncbi:hypothetical protein F5879DRAFT_943256 [Lentinula edodes]|nr:hypothetical protein F5879DRAFT_943256 [Lentinula edodes]
MFKQVTLLLFTVLLLGLLTSAAPTPVERKSLKQLKLKRGDPEPFMRRDEAPKPSGYVSKRDEASRFAQFYLTVDFLNHLSKLIQGFQEG